MVKVLHVLGGLGLGGAESRIMDLYRHMDRSQVQFDFLLHMDEKEYERAIKKGDKPEEYRAAQHYDEEAISLGAHIYALPKYKVINENAYKKACHRFFSAHHDYNVVQGHMTSTASIYLPIAKKYRQVEPMVVIAHTRNAGVDAGLKGLMTKTLRKSLPKKADFLFACSHLAGDETFGGAPYTYIPNTIDTGKFEYNSEYRSEVRKEFDIPDDAVVIGNVARFTPQKNQNYLIDAFNYMLKNSNKELRLIFCGDGALKENCEKQAASLGISDKIIFAGNQKEVWKFYCAMDIYAFPSEYEGLPGVMVEAQTSGLTCVMSDTITSDVLLTDVTEMLSIKNGPETWGKRLLQLVDELPLCSSDEYVERRRHYSEQVREAGFDVNDQAQKMMQFYLNPSAQNIP